VKQKLIDLAVQRGRLLERSAMQREMLRKQLQPVIGAMQRTDRAMATLRQGADYLSTHPGMLLTAAATVIILRPRRIWRWSKRGLLLWSVWRKARAFGLNISPRGLAD
jgi:hypothetical protein